MIARDIVTTTVCRPIYMPTTKVVAPPGLRAVNVIISNVVPGVHYVISLRSLNPKQPGFSHHSLVLVDRLGLLAVIEARPHGVPIAARCALRIFGRAGFEEVGMLDAVQQWR